MDILVNPGAAHQRETAIALKRGCARHGFDTRIIERKNEMRSGTVACWGWRNGKALQEAGRRVLVMERGYIGDRFSWYSLAWDGLNGRGRFPLVDDNGKRFLDLFGEWPRKRDFRFCDYALVLGQVPGDASILGVRVEDWYAKAADRLLTMLDVPVYFRPHPVVVERAGGKAPASVRGMPAINGALDAAIDGAAAVAAYNSNGLTDAALRGVPLLAGDAGAMAWPVAGRGLEAPPRLAAPHRWAARLAWCQWSRAEIEDGAAWDALRGCMEPGAGWIPALAEPDPAFDG